MPTILPCTICFLCCFLLCTSTPLAEHVSSHLIPLPRLGYRLWAMVTGVLCPALCKSEKKLEHSRRAFVPADASTSSSIVTGGPGREGEPVKRRYVGFGGISQARLVCTIQHAYGHWTAVTPEGCK